MKKYLLCAALLLAGSCAWAQTVKPRPNPKPRPVPKRPAQPRKPRTNMDSLALSLLPGGAELRHKVLHINLGGKGPQNAYFVAYTVPGDTSGWYTRDGNGNESILLACLWPDVSTRQGYRLQPFDSMRSTAGDVTALFFANTDEDEEREMLVLLADSRKGPVYEENGDFLGTGTFYINTCAVFDWDADSRTFQYLEESSDDINTALEREDWTEGENMNAESVRAYLRSQGF